MVVRNSAQTTVRTASSIGPLTLLPDRSLAAVRRPDRPDVTTVRPCLSALWPYGPCRPRRETVFVRALVRSQYWLDDVLWRAGVPSGVARSSAPAAV